MSALQRGLKMVHAEWIKLWRRGFATAGLVVALIHAAVVFLIMFGIHAVQRWGAGATGGGRDLFDGLQTGEWTLFSLYLPVMGVVLLATVGELFAGEYGQRTYSLLLIRPVARWKVYLAKLSASYAYVALVLIAAALLASLLGLAAFGGSRALVAQGAELAPGLGQEQSFGLRLGELGIKLLCVGFSMLPLLALSSLLAVVTRSTALTVTYTIIALVIDAGIWMTFPWVSQALEYEIFAQIKPFTLMASRNFMFPYYFSSGEMGLADLFREGYQAMLQCLGYSLAAIGAAVAVFTYQDIE